jgi:general secretion pathway protein A
MYEAFFSLEDAPFVLTPDPRFLLRSRGHHEILTTLIYGITSQKGLMALVGDVGTGKTMLCRALLRELPKDVKSALVLNPFLSDTELLGTILDDLGVERRGSSKGELMTALSQYLLAAGAQGETVVVILDEAQQMSVEALEQIRILSTLETATKKLLQIVLSGQPELEEKLKARELRQLDQRIAIRCYLQPLSRKETVRYVDHRLRVAGLAGALPFAPSALGQVYRYSRGVPRLINLVCDRALTAAFSVKAREVTPALVKTAIRNLEGHRRRRFFARDHRWPALGWRPAAVALGAIGILLLGALGVGAYRDGSAHGLVVRYLPRIPNPAALWVQRTVNVAPSAAGLAAAPAATGLPAVNRAQPSWPDVLKALLRQTIALWGVSEDMLTGSSGGWPTTDEGLPDVPAVAARYQLSATLLPATSVEELRAMDLPAIVALRTGSEEHPYLLRFLDQSNATLISPSGQTARTTIAELEAAWSHSAWMIWRNIDLLPADPHQDLSPAVVSTVSLRLQRLGLLSAPLPTSNSDRFQEAVRRFQSSMGLAVDGIVGPKTTLALSRVTTGRFGPTLSASASPR